jgi:hypothetical protein
VKGRIGPQQSKTKDKTMKTTAKTILAAFTGIALFVGAAHGTDGITASPKARELINARTAVSAQPASPAPHACGMCKDQFVTRTDVFAKGANKPTILVAKHLCNDCVTTVTAKGQGKASRDVVTHKCSMSATGGAACCAAKKS